MMAMIKDELHDEILGYWENQTAEFEHALDDVTECELVTVLLYNLW